MSGKSFELVMGSNDTPEELKFCTKCGEDKSPGEFGKDSSKPDGLRSWCKRCRKTTKKKIPDDIIYKALENAAYRYIKERLG
jgi:hypothetical protein